MKLLGCKYKEKGFDPLAAEEDNRKGFGVSFMYGESVSPSAPAF